MSTITSTSSSSSSLYPQLTQSLLGLSAGTQPANLAQALPDYDDSPGDGVTGTALEQTAQQNLFSALADPAAAAAATTSASGLITSNLATALATQSQVPADSVLSLLQD